MIKIKNCAIYGGTFDPIHVGHIYLVNWLVESGRFDKIVVVPSGAPWQRQTSASAADRLAMTRLALAEPLARGDIEISEYEISQDSNSYAIDTVQELSRSHLAGRYTWVIGSDAFAGLDTWHEVGELAKLVEFLVISRPGSPVNPPTTKVNWTSEVIGAIDISATEIRSALASGKRVDGYLSKEVSQYIRDNGLYGVA